jgi:hypothetical protein
MNIVYTLIVTVQPVVAFLLDEQLQIIVQGVISLIIMAIHFDRRYIGILESIFNGELNAPK